MFTPPGEVTQQNLTPPSASQRVQPILTAIFNEGCKWLGVEEADSQPLPSVGCLPKNNGVVENKEVIDTASASGRS